MGGRRLTQGEPLRTKCSRQGTTGALLLRTALSGSELFLGRPTLSHRKGAKRAVPIAATPSDVADQRQAAPDGVFTAQNATRPSSPVEAGSQKFAAAGLQHCKHPL